MERFYCASILRRRYNILESRGTAGTNETGDEGRGPEGKRGKGKGGKGRVERRRCATWRRRRAGMATRI